jgi:hypothetical protein
VIEAQTVGLPDFVSALKELPARLRRRALGAAWRKAGRVVRDEARRRAPVLSASTPSGASAIRRGIRKPGTLRKAISLRTSKRDRKLGDVGVFVNVRPAPKGSRGAKNPNDPFYWRWVEFGRAIRTKGERVTYTSRGKLKTRRVTRNSGGIPPVEFLQGSARMFPTALAIFTREIAPAIQKLNVRSAQV